jgi:hypothetical protein
VALRLGDQAAVRPYRLRRQRWSFINDFLTDKGRTVYASSTVVAVLDAVAELTDHASMPSW